MFLKLYKKEDQSAPTIDKPVPREKLEKILEAGRLAPSARNIEPWHFIAVTDVEKRKILSKGRFAKFLTQSPACHCCLRRQKSLS